MTPTPTAGLQGSGPRFSLRQTDVGCELRVLAENGREGVEEFPSWEQAEAAMPTLHAALIAGEQA
jgi:hypothetical protein